MKDKVIIVLTRTLVALGIIQIVGIIFAIISTFI